jgi:hypothetical protein
MAHPDLQALVDSLLPWAKSLLTEQGDFHPFGAIMASDGRIRWVAADTGEDFPSGQILIDTMTKFIKGEAASHEIRAAAICYDARTIPPGAMVKTDVISFSLERLWGESISMFFPYEKREDGEVRYGEMFVTERGREFFSNSPTSD